ncbi:MAG: fumarylacetoacetate hydrolase family protein [Candidatus Niyogibacteria bacterium]|nr:fumarylacetoacetate hydrolase family protein [Candidatus Niyogibacteria bacterium]
MKLGTLKEADERDGRLVVVSRDLTRAMVPFSIARTLQEALDHWLYVEPKLRAVSDCLNAGKFTSAFKVEPRHFAAPLPRAYQVLDGSAYLSHVERVRRARGADMPESYKTDPLMYQSVSDHLLGCRDDIEVRDESWGIDFEAEVVVITDDVPMGVSCEEAEQRIKLIMLMNDISLRNLIPAEAAKGFGFLHSKPVKAFSMVAVTPDEPGLQWKNGRLYSPLYISRRGKYKAAPDAGMGMHFSFPELIAHAARTRSLGAGTIIGGGTVSMKIPISDFACIAERRAHEMLETGKAETPYLSFGETIRMDMFDPNRRSIFGAIEQTVKPASKS